MKKNQILLSNYSGREYRVLKCFNGFIYIQDVESKDSFSESLTTICKKYTIIC